MKLPSLLLTLLIASSLSAQTLFTYADKSVSAAEYKKAFNKVYPAPVVDKAKKMRQYLDLYVNSKLKIHEAMVKNNIPSYYQLYDVQLVPTLYLLDKDKSILAKKIPFDQIDKVLDYKLKGQ